jgi:hypothetical protein
MSIGFFSQILPLDANKEFLYQTAKLIGVLPKQLCYSTMETPTDFLIADALNSCGRKWVALFHSPMQYDAYPRTIRIQLSDCLKQKGEYSEIFPEVRDKSALYSCRISRDNWLLQKAKILCFVWDGKKAGRVWESLTCAESLGKEVWEYQFSQPNPSWQKRELLQLSLF